MAENSSGAVTPFSRPKEACVCKYAHCTGHARSFAYLQRHCSQGDAHNPAWPAQSILKPDLLPYLTDNILYLVPGQTAPEPLVAWAPVCQVPSPDSLPTFRKQQRLLTMTQVICPQMSHLVGCTGCPNSPSLSPAWGLVVAPAVRAGRYH